MENYTQRGRIRLTQYSHGSGCGCKIAPAELEEILKDARNTASDPRLIVGNQSSDDASVFDLGDGRGLIQTTDFFMPIVDAPHDFGKIAAANAMSDVYAMGGRPLTALAILGWPVEVLGVQTAAEVISGAREVCESAGIQISGGHSIESKEPFFGLSVNGTIELKHLKRNIGAQPGDLLFLTKPIGVGILATAHKRGLLEEKDTELLVQTMTQLNTVGHALGSIEGVTAMTDVTGFGLIGHLLEMCKGSGVSAEIEFSKVPTLHPNLLQSFLSQFLMPDNTMRNYKAYHTEVSKLDATQLQILCDPQTSGGLMISVSENSADEVIKLLESIGLNSDPIGRVNEPNDGPTIRIR